MASWTHPELGEFAFDDYAWRQAIYLPAFKVFPQPCGRIPERPGEVDVYIWSIDQSDVPTAQVADLLGRVVRNHQLLIPQIVAALVAEFQGIGPDTGMWWRDELASIEETIARLDGSSTNSRNVTAENVERLLSLPDLNIRDIRGHGKFTPWRDGATPVAEFGFSSPIDPEHGIGMLTDGEKIIGIGYSGDAGVFAGL